MRTVVVGASSGLGRCIGIGLAQRGGKVALMARRRARLDDAAKEAGPGTLVVECDVTDEASCQAASSRRRPPGWAASTRLVYSPGIGPLVKLVDTDAATWRRVFDTNVTGASLVTAAAIPHLTESAGAAIYLSSVSASGTPPWPGLGAYAVSKAALEKLVDAWRAEHPDVGFTRLVVGDCAGGEGDAMTQFANGWDPEVVAEVYPIWAARQYLSGTVMDVERLVAMAHAVLSEGATVSIPSITVAPRPVTRRRHEHGGGRVRPVLRRVLRRPDRGVPAPARRGARVPQRALRLLRPVALRRRRAGPPGLAGVLQRPRRRPVDALAGPGADPQLPDDHHDGPARSTTGSASWSAACSPPGR